MALTYPELQAVRGTGPVFDAIERMPAHRRRIADFFRRHHRQSYTVRQVARYLKLSPRTVQKHVDALIADGIVHEEPIV